MPKLNPIKTAGNLQVKNGGELLWPLDSSPTEEFMEGFRQYLNKPTGSVSSAFDKRVFDRFEGPGMVFHKVSVEDFAKNHLAAIRDAINHANEYAAQVYTKREEQEAARAQAKDAERDELARQRAKAEQVKLDD